MLITSNIIDIFIISQKKIKFKSIYDLTTRFFCDMMDKMYIHIYTQKKEYIQRFKERIVS